jgi:hypothetical protein
MTLRHYLSVILRFGRLVDLDPADRGILDAELCAVTLSRDFALIGSLAIMATHGRDVRPITLRRRVSPVLRFIEADLVSRFFHSTSSQQMFYFYSNGAKITSTVMPQRTRGSTSSAAMRTV